MAGVTLVEMLIAITLTGIAFAALTAVVGISIGANGQMLAQARLKDELIAVGEYIQQELRRAGHNPMITSALLNDQPMVNPFAELLQISHHPSEASNTCIEFGYDLNANGVIDRTPQERMGIRLYQESVEVRMAARRCDAGGWQNLTDESIIVIDSLEFNLTLAQLPDSDSATINYRVSGYHRAYPAIHRSYSGLVEVAAYAQ